MPAQDKRKNKIPTKVKLPRRMVTVNDLLARDDINEALTRLNEIKPHISNLMIIFTDERDERLHYIIPTDTQESMATWMLESAKFCI